MGKSSKKVKLTRVNIAEYQFIFANTLKNPVSKEVFRRFLQGVHNTESLEFLDSLSQYKSEIDEMHDKLVNKTVAEKTVIAADEEIPSTTMNQAATRKSQDMEISVYKEVHHLFREKAQALMNKYLTGRASKEINVSSASKITLQKEFEALNRDFEDAEKGLAVKQSGKKYTLQQQHYNLFTSIESVVLNELQLDVFPRFVRSDMWFEFLSTCDNVEHLLNQIAIKRDAQACQKLLYTYNDFISPVITDQDFDSLSYFLQDSPQWKLRYVADESGPVDGRSYFYSMDDNFIVGDKLPKYLKNRRLSKMVTYLPCDAMDAIELIFSAEYSTGTDPTCIKVNHIDYFPINKSMNRKYAQTMVDFHFKLFPKPVDLRLLRYTLSLNLDPNDPSHIYLIGRTVKPDLNIAPDGYSLSSCYCGYSFKQVEKNFTRFTQIMSMNFGGKFQNMPAWMNKGIMDHLFKERTKTYSQGLKQAVLERKLKGWPKIEETYGRVETLYENCNHHNLSFKMPEDGDISGLSIWDFENKCLKPASHIMREENQVDKEVNKQQ